MPSYSECHLLRNGLFCIIFDSQALIFICFCKYYFINRHRNVLLTQHGVFYVINGFEKQFLFSGLKLTRSDADFHAHCASERNGHVFAVEMRTENK